jgi:hypothetical protein
MSLLPQIEQTFACRNPNQKYYNIFTLSPPDESI